MSIARSSGPAAAVEPSFPVRCMERQNKDTGCGVTGQRAAADHPRPAIMRARFRGREEAMTAARETALGWVEAHRADWSGWNRTIWEHGETAWREYRSADWYAERLAAEGFTVERGSGGMPTAFCAIWENGPGP